MSTLKRPAARPSPQPAPRDEPDPRRARRWRRQVVSALLLLFAPVALMGIVATANEHATLGMEGAVDCDGPLGVLVFAVPAVAVYALGFAVSLRDVLRRRGWSSRIVLAICAVACALLASNISTALGEQSRDAHRDSCAGMTSAGTAA